MNLSSRLIARLSAGLLTAAFAAPALAQSYPAKPVRIVVPYPPGGPNDIVARTVGQKLSEQLGQPVIVDNKPGASGNIGAESVAKSPADGYSLLLLTTGHTINPSLYPKLGYSPLRDFAPISNLGLTPQTLVASPKSGFGSLKDFVEKAKATELSYASSGNGSASHLSMELFRTASGAKLSHVPFKGNAEALTQVFGGEIPVMFDAIPGVLAPIKSGKVKALGIASPKRSPFLPDLPTIAEQGYPGFEAVGWIGIAAPARTPEPILKTLQSAIAKALEQPEMQKRMSELAFIPVGDTPEQFTAFIRAENAKWAKAVKDSGAKVD